MTNSKPHMEKCFLCGNEFQFSHHVYDGKPLPHYKILLCSICYNGNWDGFVGFYKEKIVAHLMENKIPVPDLDEEGRLPRDG